MSTNPEFEFPEPGEGTVRYLEHSFPSPLVRWHYHNEYELHFIAQSSGRVFVGDYIGDFSPGCLVLTGPRLPHNWISVGDTQTYYPVRDMVVQFEKKTIIQAAQQFSELRLLLPLLEDACYGIEFINMHQDAAARYMHAIRDASGLSRLGCFFQFMDCLAQHTNYQKLSSVKFESDTVTTDLRKIDTIVNYLLAHYTERITQKQIAKLVDLSSAYFPRFFHKATGNSFGEFLTRIRIGKACELLANSNRQITRICYDVGYNNVSNFNRRFLERKQMTPKEYRQQIRQRLMRNVDSYLTVI